jgi:hypothetical protein
MQQEVTLRFELSKEDRKTAANCGGWGWSRGCSDAATICRLLLRLIKLREEAQWLQG